MLRKAKLVNSKNKFIESKNLDGVFNHYSETKRDIVRYELFNSNRKLQANLAK